MKGKDEVYFIDREGEIYKRYKTYNDDKEVETYLIHMPFNDYTLKELRGCRLIK